MNNNKKSRIEDLNISQDDLPDESDLAATEITQNLVFKLRDRERQTLAEINAALERIDQGTYGVCEETEEEIEAARLEAVPWTRLSLAGAEMREKRRRRFA